MIRTQIYLPENLYKDIQYRASRANRPAAELIRELLVKGVASEQAKSTAGRLDKLVSAGLRGGPKDLSSNIDHYLYGKQ